jgi:hypothetical protein
MKANDYSDVDGVVPVVPTGEIDPMCFGRLRERCQVFRQCE